MFRRVLLVALAVGTVAAAGLMIDLSPEYRCEAAEDVRDAATPVESNHSLLRLFQSPKEAIPELRGGCLAGSGSACAQLAVTVGDGRLDECARDAWTRGCNASDADACVAMADREGLRHVATRPGSREKEFRARARSLFKKACDANNATGCRKYVETIDATTAEAQAVLTKACDGGDAIGCYYQASERLRLRDETGAIQRFRQACELGNGLACSKLAELGIDREANERRTCELDPDICRTAE